MSLLWICLVIYRTAHSLKAGETNETRLLQLEFAPRSLLPGGKCSPCIVASWRANPLLYPRVSRRRSQVPTHYWLLLLAGDVEQNPGPVNYPCTICNKSVQRNQRGILCDSCKLWTHAICCGTGVSEYNKLTQAGDLANWFCPSCLLAELPHADATKCTETLLSNAASYSSQPGTLATPEPSSHIRGRLTCRCLNARSISNKTLELHALLLDLDILAITETFLSDEILDSEFQAPSHTVFRKDRNRQGGGVMIFVRNTIPATRRHDLETDCELLWIELCVKPSPILLGIFYRPPHTDSKYLSYLQHSLASISHSSSVVLCGDFNLAHIDWQKVSPTQTCKLSTEFCDTINDHSLDQLVSEPTRNGNILDLLLTNTTGIIHDVEVVEGIHGSDHEAIHFSIKSATPRRSTAPRAIYNFRAANFDQFREVLSKIPWDCCFLSGSIEEAWSNFKDLFFSAADQCIPKSILRRKKRMSWLTDETLSQIRLKRSAFKKCRKTKADADLSRYKKINNKVRNLTRRDHLIHLNSITEDLHKNQKPFWSWIKNMRGGHPPIPDLHYLGAVLTSAFSKAKAFNQYFTSVYTKEDASYLDELSCADCSESSYTLDKCHISVKVTCSKLFARMTQTRLVAQMTSMANSL